MNFLLLIVLPAIAMGAIAIAEASAQQRSESEPWLQFAQNQALRASDTRVTLRTGQRLHLKGGDYLVRLPGGVVQIVEMNGLMKRTFSGATAVRDARGVIWLLAGGRRIRVGVAEQQQAAPQQAPPQGVLRASDTRLTLRTGRRLHLKGGDYLVRLPGGVVQITTMNGLVKRTFSGATVVRDPGGVIWLLADGRRIRAGELGPARAEPEHAEPQPALRSGGARVRDHRQAE